MKEDSDSDDPFRCVRKTNPVKIDTGVDFAKQVHQFHVQSTQNKQENNFLLDSGKLENEKEKSQVRDYSLNKDTSAVIH